MPLRLIEIIAPEEAGEKIASAAREHAVIACWRSAHSDDCDLVRVLLDVEHTEAVMDTLESRFATADGFRVMLFSIEATLPQPDVDQPNGEGEADDDRINEDATHGRISRDELYDDIVQSSRPTRVTFAMTVLSAIVAAIGLMRDDVAVILGAMVIAPLLGPNMAFSLATTLGDMKLGLHALRGGAIGLATALAIACGIGYFVGFDPNAEAIRQRTEVGLGDVVLAIASGMAGALAVTSGASAALIGVMVAVALMPPLVVFGLLLASGHLNDAAGALLLVSTNLICINLAGVVTFVAQGIRPRAWVEKDRARKATWIAVATWLVLLAGLVTLILVAFTTGDASRQGTP
ncbi:MAG: TIGR00341 family protein [Planctomycetaceae bacterium]